MTMAQESHQQDLEFRFVASPLPSLNEADSSPTPPPATLRRALEQAELLVGDSRVSYMQSCCEGKRKRRKKAGSYSTALCAPSLQARSMRSLVQTAQPSA